MEILDIVDDNDNVIGKESREMVHSQGLKHREIHVWFFNDDKQVVLQKRGLNVDTNPGLLHVSVGGHVDLGKSYEESAVNEVLEEAGIKIGIDDLIFIDKLPFFVKQEYPNGKINNAFRAIYAYRYNDSIDKLTPEAGGKSDGFVWRGIDDLLSINGIERKEFVKSVLSEEYLVVLKKIKALI